MAIKPCPAIETDNSAMETSTTMPTALPSPSLSPKSSLTSEAPSKPLNITEYANPNSKIKKRCRTIMTPYQSRVLRRVLDHTAFPSTEVREQLARMLGMKPRTVQIWFQNQRQKSRQGSSASPVMSDGSDCSLSPSASPDFASLSAAVDFASAEGSVVSSNEMKSTTSPSAQPLKFHGTSFKTLPGYTQGRSNTAASIATQRAIMNSVNNANGSVLPPPPTPQIIPFLSAPMMPSPSSSAAVSSPHLPLDLLASAVSNFRPNGYSYYPPNRLAPLTTGGSPILSPQNRAVSPAASPNMNGSGSEKLPSLKALAQVALEMDTNFTPQACANPRRPW